MLIVSIHDVAQSTIGEVRWLLDRLDAAGVRRRVLKVIPAEGGQPASTTSKLAGLITDEAARGSEIVLHGWTHRADGRHRGASADRARARLFAADAAEFLTLDHTEMSQRLRAGRDWLMAIGVRVTGFCAPAWLAAPELSSAARLAGFRYLVWLRGLRDLQRRRWLPLPPIGYLGVGAGQERLAGIGVSLISRPLRTALRTPHRIVLHPQGARDSRDCARVLDEIARLASRLPSATYGDLIGA